ncbi:Protein kinase-like domain protein [Fusarium austroafricanum]|uniref:Protein kinase-like domain protein n=1 Tax=Fusarium austroafricanum TaxID=2364996 RepID=A0A8H4P3V8_9HYPO|nr:Protein kinase-like domain protein [Fusarium austroafricanum]
MVVRYLETLEERWDYGSLAFPDRVAASWIGEPSSFTDIQGTKLYPNPEDMIPVAEVLRHRRNFRLQATASIPLSWRPFGQISKRAVEIELWLSLKHGTSQEYDLDLVDRGSWYSWACLPEVNTHAIGSDSSASEPARCWMNHAGDQLLRTWSRPFVLAPPERALANAYGFSSARPAPPEGPLWPLDLLIYLLTYFNFAPPTSITQTVKCVKPTHETLSYISCITFKFDKVIRFYFQASKTAWTAAYGYDPPPMSEFSQSVAAASDQAPIFSIHSLPQLPILPITANMTAYDEVAQANADDECRAWIHQLIAARDDVVAFVDARLDGKGTGEYLGFFKGSFNLSFHIGFGGQRPGVLIRFAKPGHTNTPWRTEKVTNEVRTIQYLRQHTTIPVPCIRCWGLAEESPHQLGPFIIMDFIDGVRLSTFLKQPTEDEDADLVLNPNIKEEILDTIYNQLADYILQLSQLNFSLIGAISQDASESWAVTSRPLTYDMNELATGTGYPTNQLPAVQFHRASDYFQSVSNQRLLHLKTQRNLTKDEADVRRRFIARHRFKQLIPEYCIDDAGPF